jgi:protocatechuate 3,4-dioxygenase beta subunit
LSSALATLARMCLLAVLLAALALAACGGDSNSGGANPASEPEAATTAAAISKCRAGAEPTPEQTEGPYYRAGPPKRSSLLASGVKGRRLRLRGRVLGTDCTPVARARVDFWQADGNGAYDNEGYRLRGYQLTTSQGRYQVETVVPGLYEGRTRHIHVKVRPPGSRTLTTQLYFPKTAQNRGDPIFVPETVVRLRRGARPWRASFDFVVER